MTDLTRNTPDQCQWIGPSTKTLSPTCGCKPVLGRAYCEEHLWLVYQQGTAVHRRKDTRRAQQVWDIENAFNEAVAELEEEGYNILADRWAPEAEPAE